MSNRTISRALYAFIFFIGFSSAPVVAKEPRQSCGRKVTLRESKQKDVNAYSCWASNGWKACTFEGPNGDAQFVVKKSKKVVLERVGPFSRMVSAPFLIEGDFDGDGTKDLLVNISYGVSMGDAIIRSKVFVIRKELSPGTFETDGEANTQLGDHGNCLIQLSEMKYPGSKLDGNRYEVHRFVDLAKAQ